MNRQTKTRKPLQNALPPSPKWDEPTIRISACEESILTWANRSYIREVLRSELQKANTLIVPGEGFRDKRDLRYFPVGTEELFHFFRDSAQGNLSVDICIEDDEYQELAINDELLILAGFVVTSLVAPLVVDLIGEYIKRRLGSHVDTSAVRTNLTIWDQATGRSVLVSYEGPASKYRETIEPTLQQLKESGQLPDVLPTSLEPPTLLLRPSTTPKAAKQRKQKKRRRQK